MNDKQISNENVDLKNIDTAEPSISIDTIRTMLTIINLASQRGAFHASELSTVGKIHDELLYFIAWVDENENNDSIENK